MERNKPFGQFGDRRAVPKVGLHETLDGTLRNRSLDVPLVGDSQLLVPDQDILTPAGREVQIDADMLQKLVGRQQDASLVAAQGTLQAKRIDTCCSEAGKADPAEQVQIPQTAGRAFDVRFELLDGGSDTRPALFRAMRRSPR